MLVTPNTPDGVVVSVNEDRSRVEATFQLPKGLPAAPDELVFCGRSRLARLGIDARLRELHVDADARVATADVAIEVAIPSLGLADRLDEFVTEGLGVGRLVWTPRDRVLDAAGLVAAIESRIIQVPQTYGVRSDGNGGDWLELWPQPVRYSFDRPLTRDELAQIVFRESGREQMSRLQVEELLRQLVLQPGEGVVTSCPLFLHEHYVVLDTESHAGGRHLSASVLDPVATRSSRIYLEIVNDGPTVMVNPYARARVYRALPGKMVWSLGTKDPVQYLDEPSDTEDEAQLEASYDDLLAKLEALTPEGGLLDYACRPFAWFSGMWPEVGEMNLLASHTSTGKVAEPNAVVGNAALGRHQLSAEILEATLAEHTEGHTLLLSYFPNFEEHRVILAHATTAGIARIVFRLASFEHGPFLSSTDHSRIADYSALGIDLYWCNESRGQLARHFYLKGRGFFGPVELFPKLHNSMMIAFYGSSRPLTTQQSKELVELVKGFKEVFGDRLVVVTGGGPGAMEAASEAAASLGLYTGGNLLETPDQSTNERVDFYQTFQGSSRHTRQRWFDACAMQVVCVGGVGTLEEIGLTLTDYKLGQLDPTPLLFFGSSSTDGSAYWTPMKQQFDRFLTEGRAPRWLGSYLHVTSSPSDAVAFVRQTLRIA